MKKFILTEDEALINVDYVIGIGARSRKKIINHGSCEVCEIYAVLAYPERGVHQTLKICDVDEENSYLRNIMDFLNSNSDKNNVLIMDGYKMVIEDE